jgi:hypothetical protein
MSVVGRRPWKGTDLKLVKENYASKGPTWCGKQIGRTKKAVQSVAQKNGWTASAVDLLNPSTPLIDAQIKAAYTKGYGAIGPLAKRIGKTRSWVSRRGQELGLTLKPAPWMPYTPEETEFVEKHAHLSRQRISALMRKHGWSRTAASIQKFLIYHRLVDNGDHLTPQSLAVCLGVDIKVVRRWAVSGELVGDFRNGVDEFGAWRVFALADVAKFIVRHSHRVDLRKADGPWLIDLLARYGSLGLIEEKDQWRRILALHELGKSNREIAEILETKPNIVASTLSQRRARPDQQGEAA